MTDNQKISRAFCPTCGSNIRVDVLFEKLTSWSEDSVDGSDRYWTLQCRGCDRIFFGHGSTFSEDTEFVFDENTGAQYLAPVERITFYPRASHRRKPAWFGWQFHVGHSELSTVLHEVYSALDHELSNLAASGIRTVFDATAHSLGVKGSLSFDEKIEALRKDQHITGRERDYLRILTEAGGAAVHSGWKPEPEHLSTLMDILEGLLHRSLVLPAKAENLEKAIAKSRAAKDVDPSKLIF